ncbi:DMT family transporter [Luethyella okanaganae]|uniref:DMT family transporter n=1 Tax=Luethyella okanaganae TaxID=69372 RepID=A0ABW1VBI3_9MICO
MHWLILVISAVFEAVWATALGHSNGLTELLPSILFLIALLISLGGLSYAMKAIPIGVAYSVWVGIGASLTVIVAMITGAEPVSVWKPLFIAGIVACVIGLKAAHKAPEPDATKPADRR